MKNPRDIDHACPLEVIVVGHDGTVMRKATIQVDNGPPPEQAQSGIAKMVTEAVVEGVRRFEAYKTIVELEERFPEPFEPQAEDRRAIG
jgi:hypothetical protein